MKIKLMTLVAAMVAAALLTVVSRVGGRQPHRLRFRRHRDQRLPHWCRQAHGGRLLRPDERIRELGRRLSMHQ